MLERARPFLFPLLIALISSAWLAQNFYLLPSTWRLLPFLFLSTGLFLLLGSGVSTPRPAHAASPDRHFRIAKADSISASLVIDNGMADVRLAASTDKRASGAPDESATLITGQYARTPPAVHRHFQHATIHLHHRQSSFFTQSDWRLQLAPELFWQFEIRSWLGDLWLDCGELILEGGSCSSVMGTLHITPPARASAPLTLRNALGDIHISVPPDRSCRIHIHHNRYTRIHANELRYVPRGQGSYAAGSLAESAQPVHLELHPGLGDVYLE
ncbi:MAG: hypothetical protein OXF83_03990 [Anaerolineaceae bacterium]|nr:hypothetical protein [Anaerolineaceae bacterium]